MSAIRRLPSAPWRRRGGRNLAGDMILFSDALGAGQNEIMKVPASGGRPEPMTAVNFAANEWRHGWPRFLPGGKTFVLSGLHKRLDSTGV